MNLAALAAWAASHPWMASTAVVLALFVVFGLAQKWRRPNRPLLRSAKEQAAFKPVQTVYTPKRYRRER